MEVSRKITRGKDEPIPVLVSFERGLAKLLTVIKIGPEAEENQPLEAWKPWVGVSTQVLTRELSEALGLPRTTRGIRIAQVFSETPAEKDGLLAGDLLFRIDGQIIMAHRPEDAEVFGNMIKEYRTDATIQLQGLRNGTPLDLNLTLEKRPPPSNELPKKKEKTFEFTVRELSFADRVNARVDEGHPGLLVENVEPAGWASLAGLRQGDLLLEIDGETQVSIEQFEGTLQKLIDRQSKRVILFVKRGIHTLFLELEPDWDES
jgi:serine protease Do